jgi:hypothetical protein
MKMPLLVTPCAPLAPLNSEPVVWIRSLALLPDLQKRHDWLQLG